MPLPITLRQRVMPHPVHHSQILFLILMGGRDAADQFSVHLYPDCHQHPYRASAHSAGQPPGVTSPLCLPPVGRTTYRSRPRPSFFTLLIAEDNTYVFFEGGQLHRRRRGWPVALASTHAEERGSPVTLPAKRLQAKTQRKASERKVNHGADLPQLCAPYDDLTMGSA